MTNFSSALCPFIQSLAKIGFILRFTREKFIKQNENSSVHAVSVRSKKKKKQRTWKSLSLSGKWAFFRCEFYCLTFLTLWTLVFPARVTDTFLLKKSLCYAFLFLFCYVMFISYCLTEQKVKEMNQTQFFSTRRNQTVLYTDVDYRTITQTGLFK